jgi:hypothetical protein
VGSPVSQHGRRISENQRKLGGGITIAEAMSSTSWEPQTPVVDKMDGRLEALMPDDMNSTTDLYSIRLKMEEKRKRIESDKRQQELLANRQREKVGKAAFLQVTDSVYPSIALSALSPTFCLYYYYSPAAGHS